MTSELKPKKHGPPNSQFVSDYGMVFVLLLLCALFSILTLKQQHPTGAAAGTQVANKISAANDNAFVLIVTRNTAEDLAFSDAARAQLEANGTTVLATVNGGPADVRAAIEQTLADNKAIDAIAANDVTAKWSVYDRFESVGSAKCVTPEPYTWPDFLKLSNVLGVANQTAIYAIIAIGMTMVIITGGIDLGVGSLVALAAVASTLFIRNHGGAEALVTTAVQGTLLGILVCAACGLFVGFMVTKFHLPPFIVTLAIMMMASGLSFRLTEGQSIPNLPESFFLLGGGQTLGVPNPVLLMIVLYIIAHVVMSRTVFGRYVYAIGGNEEAARLSGVPVKRMLLAVYTICGGLAGLGGVVLASQLRAGDPKFGLMYELEVIAAVVVGGTSLMGGQGKIFGTLIGAFTIAVIKNGMNLTNVDAFNQKIVLGAVLLGAVLLDTLKRRRG
jgi:ribose transport system permease protein